MQLNFNGTNQTLAQAVQLANTILRDPSFYDQIAAVPNFEYSTYTGQQVADEIRNLQQNPEVDTYWRPWSGATAQTQTKININTAKLNRPLPSIVNTLLHENTHFVDWAVNQNWDYTDRNVWEDPPLSAPYKIGAIAEAMATQLLAGQAN